jgi:hypothetical protein
MGEHYNNSLEEQHKKKGRMTAVLLALATIISICSLVFAYTQRLEAQRMKDLSLRCHDQLIIAQSEAYQQQKIAEAIKGQAELQRLESVRNLKLALLEAKKCKQNQKGKTK